MLWFRSRSSGLVGTRGQQRSNGRLVDIPWSFAKHMPRLSPVFAVEERCGKRSVPAWKYCLCELSEVRFLARFFPVIGKHRLIAGQKAPHQDQIAIVIHAY